MSFFPQQEELGFIMIIHLNSRLIDYNFAYAQYMDEDINTLFKG